MCVCVCVRARVCVFVRVRVRVCVCVCVRARARELMQSADNCPNERAWDPYIYNKRMRLLYMCGPRLR